MPHDGPGRRVSLGRLIPIAVLLTGLGLFFVFDLHHYLSFETLKEQRAWLLGFVDEHGPLAAFAFLGLYAAAVAFSLPGGALLTITGGFLFVLVLGPLLSVLGATIGAVVLFLATRTALYDLLHARAGPALRKMEDGFREDAMSYLLVLRLVPLFPFWLVNIVPALLGVPVRTYVIATFFGIMPGAFVYASVGNGLGALIAEGKSPDFGAIFRGEILLALSGLVILSLVPVVYKRLKARKAVTGQSGRG